ncbi:MAG: DUF4412 domain-containing protein [Pseudomonadota bacterium]
MKLKLSCAALAAAGIALSGTAAFADTTIVYANSEDGAIENGKTEIANGKIRMSAPGGEGFAIFDSTNGQFIAINQDDRSYMVMGKEQVQKIADMQKQVMAQMEQQLAALPASQRAQMKKMMSSMMPKMAGEAKPRSYERTGESRKIAGYDCEVIEVYAGDSKSSEQCVTTAKELDIPEEDYAAVRGMMTFVQDLANSFGQMSDGVLDFGEPGKDEIPVQYTHYDPRMGTSTGQLKSVSHDDIDPLVFEIPDGYKEIEMPDMSDLGF